MATPLVQNLTIVRGDTKKWTITVARNGIAVPLTGAHIWFTAKSSLKDGDDRALIALLSGSPTIQGSVVLESPLSAGIATLTLYPAATEGLIPSVGLQYDVQLQEADGTVTTVAEGVLQVVPDVTQRRVYLGQVSIASHNRVSLRTP